MCVLLGRGLSRITGPTTTLRGASRGAEACPLKLLHPPRRTHRLITVAGIIPTAFLVLSYPTCISGILSATTTLSKPMANSTAAAWLNAAVSNRPGHKPRPPSQGSETCYRLRGGWKGKNGGTRGDVTGTLRSIEETGWEG